MPLLFRKGRAGSSLAVAGSAALDVHMTGLAFIVRVVYTFLRLTVNADGLSGMACRTLKRVITLPLLRKAFTAGLIASLRMLSAHHDITLAAQMILIVHTVIHCTL